MAKDKELKDLTPEQVEEMFWAEGSILECMERIASMLSYLEKRRYQMQARESAEALATGDVLCVVHQVIKDKLMTDRETRKTLKPAHDQCRKKFKPETAVMKVDRQNPSTGTFVSYFWCSEPCYRHFNIACQNLHSPVVNFLPDPKHQWSSSSA